MNVQFRALLVVATIVSGGWCLAALGNRRFDQATLAALLAVVCMIAFTATAATTPV